MDSGESRKFRLYSLVDFARAPWFVRAVPARRAFLSGGGDRTRTCMTFRSAVFKTAALPIMRPLRAWLPGTITHARELAQLRALRLGRPPCGKALPYRSNLSLFRRLRLNRCGGLASFFVSANGKAEPFRTDGGKAAPGLLVPGFRQVGQESTDAKQRVSNLKWQPWQVVEGTVHGSSSFNRVRPAMP